MNNKNQRLNKLFEDWRNRYKKADNFVKDGIINEALFESTSQKILFITKEPNDPKQEGTDFREWWKKEVFYGFSYRIAEWAFGILNNFPPYDEIWPKQNGKYDDSKGLEAIQSIAFMNIKKSGGVGIANNVTIGDHIEKYKDLIKKQISIIDPDIIVLGLSWTAKSKLIFPGIKWIKSGYGIPVAKYDTYTVIDFYHPSARNGLAASYCLLKCIFNTDIYKNL